MENLPAYFRPLKQNLISKREYNVFRKFGTFRIRVTKKEYYRILFADMTSITKKDRKFNKEYLVIYQKTYRL